VPIRIPFLGGWGTKGDADPPTARTTASGSSRLLRRLLRRLLGAVVLGVGGLQLMQATGAAAQA
jgi:hypothetical protein